MDSQRKTFGETGLEELQNQIQTCMMQRHNLEAIFDSVADGIIAVDLKMRISNLNEAAQHMTGYTRQDAVGESCMEILGLTYNEDELCKVFQARRKVDGLSACIVDRRGQKHDLVVSTRVLKDEEGSEKGLVAIVRDVTELEALRSQLQGRDSFCGMISKNHIMQEIYQLIEDLADSDATVFILGESGTGKELVASAIHQNSQRSKKPFVKVNCSALSVSLLESELFGHVKGAFTGAIRDKIGRFEMAAGGTIFLDEIGDVSASVQVKLLRVLQEREIERVGSSETLQVDTRVIAATNRDVVAAIKQGTFREDLYYRLHVMPIELPPLRERKEDIPLLVKHFIEKFNAQTSRLIQTINPDALALLMDYHWPGNVRELGNAIEHAFIKCRGDVLLPECLPRLEPVVERKLEGSGEVADAAPAPDIAGRGERERLIETLRACRWNRSQAAARLDMHRTTLWRKIRELGIDKDSET